MDIHAAVLNSQAIIELENFEDLIWVAKGDILLTATGFSSSTLINIETPVYSTRDRPLLPLILRTKQERAT